MMWRQFGIRSRPPDGLRLLRAVIAAIMVLSWAPWPVGAQSPDREEAFVWATTVFSGVQYESTFYPPDADTLYLLAGYDHVLAPRQTMIYYWPITNRILADWLAKNDVVEGQLVIQDDRGDAQTLDITDYVIQFNSDAPDETLALYVGEEARKQYTQFDQARKEFADALHANYQLQLEYQNALTAAAQAATKGETLEVPEPPPQLPPFNWYSTDIKRAFVVNLPPGDYEIFLRLPDGREQATSRKKLHVFAPRRQGVGYTIVPQAKWTVPEESNDPQNVIYALPDVTLYLQPFQEFEANQLAYARSVDAQREGVRGDRFTWVHTYPYPNAKLQLLKDGEVIQEVSRRDYFVHQLPGASLGYEVELYDPESDRSPSFSGYAVQVNRELSRYQIRLVDENGQVVPGSVREIRLLTQPDQRILVGLSILPLLMGLGVVFWRRNQLERLEHLAE